MKIISLLFLIACSSMSDKNAYVDSVKFDGGRLKQLVWKEKLEFKRVSWFSQSHLEFDTFIAELKKDSKFTAWLSGSEKKYLNQCDKLFISMSTSNFSKVLTDAMYMSEMKTNNFNEVIPTRFIEHLKMHPDYVRWNLNMYKPRMLCADKNVDIITINFPSFKTMKIDL